MKVSHAMSTQVDFVSVDTSVKDVCRLIFGRGINGVPVCKGKKVVGFITERDILAKFYPSMQEYIEDPVHSRDFEVLEQNISEIFELTVEKIMSKNPAVVTPDTPLLKAQSIMFIHKVGRLPVVNEKDYLVGIIAKGDIFRSVVGNQIPFEQDEQFHDWLSRRYDLIVDWKRRLAKEIPDLVALFKQEKIHTVLDVGCGIGTHAIALGKEGFRVTGLDRSSRMIYVASEKTKNLPDSVKDNVQFVHHVYKNFEKVFSENFDAAIFMGTGLAHDQDPYQILQEVNKILVKRALVVCQITNFEKVLTVNKRLFDFNVRKSPFVDFKEHAFLRFYDPPENGMLTYNVSVFDRGSKRWKFRGMNSVSVNPLNREKLILMFKKLKFSKITCYGGEEGFYYDYLFRKPFDPIKSDVLVAVAKRP